MTMADTNTIQSSFDKTSYVPGDKMTVSWTGTVTRKSDVTVTATLDITLSDGSVVHATTPPATVVGGQTADMAPKLTAAKDGQNRSYTIALDGKTATAVA